MKKVLIFQRYAAEFRKSFFEQVAQSVHLTLSFSDERDTIKVENSIVGAHVVSERYTSYLGGAIYRQIGVSKRLAAIRPDVVVITPTPRNLTNFVIARYCRRHQIRVVGWGMGKMPGRAQWRQRVHDVLVGHLVRQLDHVICYSTSARKYYSSLGLPANRLSVAYNGVDTIQIGASMPRGLQAGPRKENLGIVTVGRLVPHKSFETVISAVHGLPGVTLTIVGDGPQRSVLVDYAQKLGADVTFCGHLTGDDLYSVIKKSDIFVLPGLGGLAIHEAMALGLPVICGVADGTECDLVVNGRTGLRIPNINSDNLRDALLDCLSGRFDLDYMGHLARRFVFQHRSRPKMIRTYLEALNGD